MRSTDPMGEEYYNETFAQRRTAMTTKLLELTADGEWHEREELIRAAAHVVEPGPAFRFAERQRINGRKLRARKSMSPAEYEAYVAEGEAAGWPRPPYRDADMDSIVRSGARAMLIERIHSSRRFEVTERDGKAYVRRVPIHDRYADSAAAKEREAAKREGREPDVKRIYNDRYNERKRAQRRAKREQSTEK